MDKTVKLSELVNPTDRQKSFVETVDTHKYTLYGGAKGGGKSHILRWILIRQLIKWAKQGHKRVRVGLFCEDYPTLSDRQGTKIETEFPKWLGTLSTSKTQGFAFVLHEKYGGGILALRNLDDPSKYASSEFAMVAVDELTKNPRTVFDQLRSIIRWPGIEDTKFIAGTNPGEIGHEWVKLLFIDRVFTKEDPEPDQVAFIKSLPTDNPHNAASYLEELQRLPEKLRKAYWDGSWDVFEGQFFSEWDKEVHVVKPFEIPEHWIKVRSIDPSGRAGFTSAHWYALSPEGDMYVYREYYKTGKDQDEHAKGIAKISVGEHYPYTCIDSAAFDKLGLPETTAEIYERYQVDGLVPAMKKRVMGWNTVHQYLRHGKDQTTGEIVKPKLKVFSNCIHMIRTIPLAIHDDLNPQDVKSVMQKLTIVQDGQEVSGNEHQDCLDDLRYILQTLREQKAPQKLSIIEKRIAEIKARDHERSFNYNYSRS